ncbi:MAG: hypothetical protein WBB82_03935 [Limnothrix sp.]
MVSVAEKFGDKNEKIALFNSSVLYALSAPSTPESVIEKATEKVESGENVTAANVKDWKLAIA